MKFMYFSIKYGNSDIILKKTTLYLKPFVLLQSHLLLCWNGFCDISVPLCYVSVTLSKKILDSRFQGLIPWNSMELAEAVQIG